MGNNRQSVNKMVDGYHKKRTASYHWVGQTFRAHANQSEFDENVSWEKHSCGLRLKQGRQVFDLIV